MEDDGEDAVQVGVTANDEMMNIGAKSVLFTFGVGQIRRPVACGHSAPLDIADTVQISQFQYTGHEVVIVITPLKPVVLTCR